MTTPQQPPTEPADQTAGVMEVYRPLLLDLFSKQQAALQALQDSQSVSYEGPVYHYTGDIGLFEIVRSGTLWVSDYTSMNDPSEIQYGIRIGLQLLEAELAARNSPVMLRSFVGGFKGRMDNVLEKVLRAFILSMSIKGDELTQWRSYGDNAAGYRLEFDSSILDSAFNQLVAGIPNNGSGSFRVLYDEGDLRTRLSAHVRNALDVVGTMPRGPMQEMARVFDRIGVDLALAFIYTSLYYKHSAYESEQEYRYFIGVRPGQPPPLLNRARRNKFIDYLSLDWKASFANGLKSIRIGPNGNKDLAEKFIADIRAKYLAAGMPLVVDQSAIPYRG
jgi:hypothetical protein